MIPALLIGREGSTGFPGKNVYPILGKPMMEYPLLAAQGCPSVQGIYVSTDSPRIKEISRSHGAHIIDRPQELCTPESLGEDVFVHGYHAIRESLPASEQVEMLVLLMCNAPTITSQVIEEGIGVLRAHPDYDSAVSVSRYNMWSPLRARRIGNDGLLHPFLPFESFGDPKTLNCDRDSQGDVWFADMGVSIVRARNLEHLEDGLLPQKWMGQRIYPLKQWGGLDIDYEWQVPQASFWLQAHGYREMH